MDSYHQILKQAPTEKFKLDTWVGECKHNIQCTYLWKRGLYSCAFMYVSLEQHLQMCDIRMAAFV